MSEIIGGLLGAALTALAAIVVGYFTLRGKRLEVDADIHVRPQLAFYEDLTSRVRDLESDLTALMETRDEVKGQLAAALAQVVVLEGRIVALERDVAHRDETITRIRAQREHYRALALCATESAAHAGLAETSEHLAAEISDADEATSIKRST